MANNPVWSRGRGSSFYGASVGGMNVGDPFLGKLLGGVGKVLKGAVGGFLGGGPMGAITGAIGAVAPRPRLVKPGQGVEFRGPSITTDRFGLQLPTLRIGAPPGVREPRVNGAGRGLPMVGEIGAEPEVDVREHRVCPRGQVLAVDGRCYPRSMVPRSLREWVPTPRVPITRRDVVAIRRAASAQDRVKKLAGDVGFTCKKKGTGGKKK